MSNLVEIVAKALYYDDTVGTPWEKCTAQELWISRALAVIAAIEKEGYKVMAREPTEEMVKMFGMGPTGYARSLFAALFDAAPRYGEPRE